MTDDMFIYICLSLNLMKACKLIITRAFFYKELCHFVLLRSWEKLWPSKTFLINLTTC